MCCGSHNAASPFRSTDPMPTDHHPVPNACVYPEAFSLGDVIRSEEAATEEERCKCLGMPSVYLDSECVCLRKMDGEDMRCSVCRVYCPIEWTPRLMSAHALQAKAIAEGRTGH